MLFKMDNSVLSFYLISTGSSPSFFPVLSPTHNLTFFTGFVNTIITKNTIIQGIKYTTIVILATNTEKLRRIICWKLDVGKYG